MSWGDYGFPDVTMLSPYTPSLGIYLAAKERFRITYGRDPDGFELSVPDLMTTIPNHPSSTMLLMPYVNHLLDMNEHPDHIFWDGADMQQEIINRDTSGQGCLLYGGLIYTQPDMKMMPDYPALIAQQRKLSLNLQKIAVIPAFIRMGTGMSSGSHSTIEGVYQSAVDDFHEDFSIFRAWDGTFDTFIQGSPGSYYCIIHRPIEIRPDYTHYPGLEGLASHLYFRASPWSYNSVIFDAHGMGVLHSRERFSAIPLPYYSLTPAHPDNLPDNLPASDDMPFFHCGYDCIGQDSSGPYFICGVDVSSLFEFYDNVDEIPIP